MTVTRTALAFSFWGHSLVRRQTRSQMKDSEWLGLGWGAQRLREPCPGKGQQGFGGGDF